MAPSAPLLYLRAIQPDGMTVESTVGCDSDLWARASVAIEGLLAAVGYGVECDAERLGGEEVERTVTDLAEVASWASTLDEVGA